MLEEMAEKIWVNKGKEPGKTVTVIGGTHGDERTGVEVVLKLKQMIESGELRIRRGTLYLIHGNPRAIELHQRGSEPDLDLNRCYPTDLLLQEPNGTYEDARAHMIAPYLKQSDIVVDIHSTSKPSESFLACLYSAHHEEIYRWFVCDKILTDPKFVLGGSSITTDEYTEAHGGIGICFETGLSSDVSRVDEVTKNTVDLLIDQQLVDGALQKIVCERDIYEMTERIILTSAGFHFAEGFGNHSWEPFSTDQILGYHGTEPLLATYDGVIVFPKNEKMWTIGKSVCYLARHIEE